MTKIIGAERAKRVKAVQKRYEKGKSIRQISKELGWSYGHVHNLLDESGVPKRPRGGANR